MNKRINRSALLEKMSVKIHCLTQSIFYSDTKLQSSLFTIGRRFQMNV